MTEPAQRPPNEATDQAMQAILELIVLALSVLVGFSVGVSLVWLGALPEQAAWSGVVLGPVIIGTAGITYLVAEQLLARSDEPVRPLVWRRERKHPLICVLIALGGVVVAMVGSSVLGLAQEHLFGVEVEEQEAILKLIEQGDGYELVLLSVSAVVLAPLTEELLFRHMFFRRLLHRAGPTLAWVLPAVAFSLFHYNPSGLAIYVWLGLVFAYAYLLSGRLWVAMAVHAGHNAVALCLLLYLPDAPI